MPILFPAQRTWDSDGIPVLRVTLSLPNPEGREARCIRSFYRFQARSFLRYCESVLLPQAREALAHALAQSQPFFCQEASLDYTVTYQEGSLLSLYTQSQEPGGDLFRRGDTWDLATGAVVPLSRFLRRGWRKRFTQAALTDIARQSRGCCLSLPPDWTKRVKQSVNSRDFYLTEEGLVFFLPQYTLGSSLPGIPTFTLPWNTL